MNFSRIIFILLLISYTIKTSGQIDAISDKAYRLDSLRTNSFSINLNILFSTSDSETGLYPDIKLSNSLRFNYLFTTTDIDLSLRQILERNTNGRIIFKHYLMLSSGVFKYKLVNRNITKVNKIYVEPIFIFQNNSERGLDWRYQTGLLLHPWAMVSRKFKVNLGIGIVYDWSSWEVNNMNEINSVSQELKDKILFINSHTTLKNNMNQTHSEFRPMLFLNLNYYIKDVITFNLNTSLQQSLKSPYNEIIKEKYPELKKVYPYLLSQFATSVKIYKGFELKFTISVDYENNNLSLYKSSWTYSTLFGISWRFSNQKFI